MGLSGIGQEHRTGMEARCVGRLPVGVTCGEEVREGARCWSTCGDEVCVGGRFARRPCPAHLWPARKGHPGKEVEVAEGESQDRGGLS